MKRFYDYWLKRESIPTEKPISPSFSRSKGNILCNCNPAKNVDHRDATALGHSWSFGTSWLNRDVKDSQPLWRHACINSCVCVHTHACKHAIPVGMSVWWAATSALPSQGGCGGCSFSCLYMCCWHKQQPQQAVAQQSPQTRGIWLLRRVPLPSPGTGAVF